MRWMDRSPAQPTRAQLMEAALRIKRPVSRALTRRRRVIIAAALALYVAHYLSSVRRIRIHRAAHAQRLTHILALCPTLLGYYWPTLLAHLPALQFAILGVKEVRARLLSL